MPETALKLAAAPLRALPAGSGQHRVVRRIYDRWLKDGESRTGRARVNGAVFDLELTDYIQAQAFLTGRCEPALVNWLARHLGPGDVCLDVGAHIGLVAIPVAKRCPEARVLAFEPHPGSAERLTSNTALNPGVEVELVAAAAGEEPSSAFLETGGPGTDWHHLGGSEGTGSPGVEVPVTTIDDVCAERGIDRIAVLKMDVEGYEPQALAGAERMLSEGRVDMIVLELVDYVLVRSETTPSELEAQVTALGYEAAEPIPMAGLNRLHPGKMGYSNFAFVRSSDGARPATTSSKS
jgi:FkbM family methyltransferase